MSKKRTCWTVAIVLSALFLLVGCGDGLGLLGGNSQTYQITVSGITADGATTPAVEIHINDGNQAGTLVDGGLLDGADPLESSEEEETTE